MNNQIKCTKCECKGYPDTEDNYLELIVITNEENVYKINLNGDVEFFDNRNSYQEIKLECPVCGETYEFDSDFIVLEEKPVLRMDIDGFKSRPIEKRDLNFTNL